MAKKINIYWDSFNGVNDDLDYIEYQEFIILVKYNSRFASSTFQSQKQEADENDIDESYFTDTSGRKNDIDDMQEYFKTDEETTLNEILRLKDIYYKLDENSRKEVWSYFKALTILSEDYIKLSH